jgi:hypothetical protein
MRMHGGFFVASFAQSSAALAGVQRRLAHQHRDQHRGNGRARHPGGCGDHLGHAGHGLDADLLHVIDQCPEVAGPHVLHIVELHLHVLPMAAQPDLGEDPAGDGRQRQQAERPHQALQQVPAPGRRGRLKGDHHQLREHALAHDRGGPFEGLEHLLGQGTGRPPGLD